MCPRSLLLLNSGAPPGASKHGPRSAFAPRDPCNLGSKCPLALGKHAHTLISQQSSQMNSHVSWYHVTEPQPWGSWVGQHVHPCVVTGGRVSRDPHDQCRKLDPISQVVKPRWTSEMVNHNWVPSGFYCPMAQLDLSKSPLSSPQNHTWEFSGPSARPAHSCVTSLLFVQLTVSPPVPGKNSRRARALFWLLMEPESLGSTQHWEVLCPMLVNGLMDGRMSESVDGWMDV